MKEQNFLVFCFYYKKIKGIDFTLYFWHKSIAFIQKKNDSTCLLVQKILLYLDNQLLSILKLKNYFLL